MYNKTCQLVSVLICGILLFAGCKKDERDINENVTAVENIFTPTDNLYINLQPASGQTQVFEWDQARAADGGLVLYEVAFDQEAGDFSQPFYTTVSDNKGISNKLTLTHGDLNKIAQLGGSAFFERKKFKWTVLSTKGTNAVRSKVSRVIDLERPGGFDVLPGEVYLTGSATENGDVLASALKMHQVSSGIFEIFTKLKSGTYHFTDGIAGTPKTYYTFDNAGINAIGSGGETTYAGTEKIVRLVLNFNDINATSVEVKTVQFWYCNSGTLWFTLPYTSNGVWKYSGWLTNLDVVSYGREERYKYKMVINDGTGDKDLWLNSTFGDPPGQDGQYPSSVAYRTIDVNRNNNSQFDWGWKMDRNYVAQGTVLDYTVSLRGSDAVYTQNYQKP